MNEEKKRNILMTPTPVNATPKLSKTESSRMRPVASRVNTLGFSEVMGATALRSGFNDSDMISFQYIYDTYYVIIEYATRIIAIHLRV